MRTQSNDPDRLDMKSEAIQILYRAVRMISFIPSVGRYNMTICHLKKFIWFRVAKVGTRTILNHLKENEVPLDVEHGNWLHYPEISFDSYFKFGFVRNPWDRLISCWHNKVVKENYFRFENYTHEKMKTFENFVNFVSDLNIDKCDRHLRSQSALIDLNMVDYLGRMETFDVDANYIFQKLGLPEKQIARKNVTSDKKSYEIYYDEHLAKKVALIYQKDIQIFGYQF